MQWEPLFQVYFDDDNDDDAYHHNHHHHVNGVGGCGAGGGDGGRGRGGGGNGLRVNRLLEQTKKCSYVFVKSLPIQNLQK